MNEAFERQAQHERGDALPVLTDGRARRARVGAVERVRPAAPTLVDLGLAQLTPVVADLEGVVAARPGEGRRESACCRTAARVRC